MPTFPQRSLSLADHPQDSKKTFGYQVFMNADQSKTKRILGFLHEIYGQNWPETSDSASN